MAKPNYAGRDCIQCQQFVWNEEWGQPELQQGSGAMIRRAPKNLPLCRQVDDDNPHGRCPKGTPENQWDWTEQNKRAFRYHLFCKATGRWPEDGRVLRNAELIEWATAEVENRTRWNAEKRLVAEVHHVADMISASIPRLT